MAVAVALQRVDKTRRNWKRVIRLTMSGSYANSGTTGDLFDFTAITNPNNLERGKLNRIPVQSRIRVLNHPPGFVAVLSIGAALTNFGIRFFQTAAAAGALAEIANGAYAAAITANPVDIEVDEQT